MELTPEQKQKCDQYIRKWMELGKSCEPTDMPVAIEAIKRAYTSVGLPVPTYFIGPVPGPYEGAVVEAMLREHVKKGTEFADDGSDLNERLLAELDEYLDDPSKRELTLNISNQCYGSMEYWLSKYDFFINECDVKLDMLNPLMDLAKVCGWWTPLSDIVIIQDKPLYIHINEQNRLHKLGGPAVKYRGKTRSDIYAVNGIRVSESVSMQTFTAEDIERERNVEVRRIMIDLYGGMERYLTDIKATVVDSDDFGTLYRVDGRDGRPPYMTVKVVNSTPEPDGSFKDYFLRVDPEAYGGLTTARAAVASTWRNNDTTRSLLFEKPEDYDPEIET